MKKFINKKYNTIALYVLLVIFITLLMIFAVFRLDHIFDILGKIVDVIMPIIWGAIIAYVLNPVLKFFEKCFKRLFYKKKEHPKACRRVSVSLTIIIFLLILITLIYIIAPQIQNSILFINDNLKIWIENIRSATTKFLENNPNISAIISDEFKDLNDLVDNFLVQIQPTLENFITYITKSALDFLIGLKDFLLGFIVSIYLLLTKDTLIAQFKKALLSILNINSYNKTIRVFRKSHSTFVGFLCGKTIDSIIIGLIAFIILSFMTPKIAILLSIIIGITNIIPFFGPIIGAIPCGLLVLLYKPSALIPFLIFILLLQQFDGNILGPRILGISTGLPAFWVIVSIFLGGGLFGFAGMVLGVPTFALIYTFFRENVNSRLKKKNMPTNTKEYADDINKFCTDKTKNESSKNNNDSILNNDENFIKKPTPKEK